MWGGDGKQGNSGEGVKGTRSNKRQRDSMRRAHSSNSSLVRLADDFDEDKPRPKGGKPVGRLMSLNVLSGDHPNRLQVKKMD